MIIKIAMAAALSAVAAWMPALGQAGSVGEAIRAYEDEDYRSAYKFFKNEEIVNPASGLAQLYLGHIDAAYGVLADAADRYIRALSYLPKDDYDNRIKALRPLVSILTQFEGGRKKALEIVERETKISGKTTMLLFCKASCDRYNERNLDLWRSVANAHVSDEVDKYAYESIAKIFRDRGDLSGAIVAYTNALKASPVDKRLLQDRASAYWQIGDTAAAVGDACLNLLANRENVDHCVLHMCYDKVQSTLDGMRGGAYGLSVDFAKLSVAYQAIRGTDAYEISKSDILRQVGFQGVVLSEVGLYGKAEEAFLAADGRKPELGTVCHMACNYERMGNFSESKRCLDVAAGMNPTDVSIYKRQADLCIMSRDAAGAKAYADTVLALEPISSIGSPLRAYWLYDDREKAEQLARGYLESASQRERPYPSPYVSGSELYCFAIAGDTLNFARGVEAARKYGDGSDWFVIALAYASTGCENEAIDAISTAFDRGFYHFVYIDKSPEFEWLKYSERFNSMMSRIQEEQMRRIERLLNE